MSLTAVLEKNNTTSIIPCRLVFIAIMRPMHFSQAAIYGIIQGLTEYLPISSSAHLVLLPLFTGWPDPGLAFDVALHWGTLVAVLFYFRREVVNLTLGFFGSLKGKWEFENRLPWQIGVATLPGAVIGFLFEKQAESTFRSPWILAGTLSVLGVLLFYADRKGSRSLTLSHLTWGKAILIGLSQGLAIIPGVSRSGITITTALLLGLDRTAAVRFSFYLSIPIIFGAGLLKAKFILHNAGDPSIWVAMIGAAVSGLAAIHTLITYVRTRSFTPFVIYRFGLSLIIMGWLMFDRLI